MSNPSPTNTFMAFPESKQRAIDAQREAKKPYQSPHVPRPAATNIQLEGASLAASAPVHQYAQPTDQVAIQSPGFTEPSQDAEAVALDLPSRYAFYEFKDLYVRPFKGKHLRKISRASEEGSLLHMVEVVSSVLSNTRNETHLAHKLTLPDFYAVMYWLRLNSYTKSIFTHTTTCVNEKHIEAVGTGQKTKESLKISMIINKSSIETIMLDTVPDPEQFKMEYPGIELEPPKMRDVLEMTEDQAYENDPEFQYAAAVAMYIKSTDANGNYIPLRTRIAVYDDMSPDDIQTIKQYEAAVSEYGIVEKIKVTCKECGASRLDKIQIDAHSFLPSVQP